MHPILQFFPKCWLKISFNKFIIINCYYSCLIYFSIRFYSVLFVTDSLSFGDTIFSFATHSDWFFSEQFSICHRSVIFEILKKEQHGIFSILKLVILYLKVTCFGEETTKRQGNGFCIRKMCFANKHSKGLCYKPCGTEGIIEFCICAVEVN